MTASFRQITLIINPAAGTGRHLDPNKLAEQFSREHAQKIQIFQSKNAGDITALTKQLSGPNHIILVAGGDGTVHEATIGLKDSSSVLGILPYGSGNGLARHLGIHHQPEKAIKQLLLQSSPRKTDLIRLNNHSFINIAGVGFDGLIAREFSRDGNRGLKTYIKLILLNFLKFAEFNYSLTTEGKTISGKAWMITFANGSEFGNGAKIAPGASITDGLMDLIIVRKPSVLKLPQMVVKLMAGKADQKKIIRIKANEVEINLDSPQELHLDGEYTGTVQHIKSSTLPGSINLLVPDSTRPI